MDGKLLLQGEVGYASGDQWDTDPEGRTHVSNSVRSAANGDDTTLSAFHFDFGYNIDLILFRELLGTITNATYARPRFRYDVNDRFYFSGQSVISMANIPVSTPGNGNFYGVELDADVGYQNDGYFMGVAYGVLFPLSAMDHPTDSAFSFGSALDNGGDAKTAQTIQFRMGLKF